MSSSEPRTLAAAWANYEANVMPAGAGAVQRSEGRNCFYAGAQTLFLLLMTELAEEKDPTEADLHAIDGIHDELTAFAAELAERVIAKHGGRG